MFYVRKWSTFSSNYCRNGTQIKLLLFAVFLLLIWFVDTQRHFVFTVEMFALVLTRPCVFVPACICGCWRSLWTKGQHLSCHTESVSGSAPFHSITVRFEVCWGACAAAAAAATKVTEPIGHGESRGWRNTAGWWRITRPIQSVSCWSVLLLFHTWHLLTCSLGCSLAFERRRPFPSLALWWTGGDGGLKNNWTLSVLCPHLSLRLQGIWTPFHPERLFFLKHLEVGKNGIFIWRLGVFSRRAVFLSLLNRTGVGPSTLPFFFTFHHVSLLPSGPTK